MNDDIRPFPIQGGWDKEARTGGLRRLLTNIIANSTEADKALNGWLSAVDSEGRSW